jgi:hypothetical protein
VWTVLVDEVVEVDEQVSDVCDLLFGLFVYVLALEAFFVM